MHLTDRYVSWEMCYIPAVNSSEVKNICLSEIPQTGLLCKKRMMQLTDYYVNILSSGNV